MAAETIRITGLRETQRAFRKMGGQLAPELRVALREAAKPVAATARGLEERWQGASIRTIGPKVTVSGAAVTQRAKKVTGLRPDFGALQMRQAMIPALQEHIDDIEVAADVVLEKILNIGG